MPNQLKFAFAGLRHGHVLSIMEAVNNREDLECVAICEEDGPTRQQVSQEQNLEIAYTSHDQMLREADCDVVVVGDTYGRRGALVIKALEAGKHVISDKPICTKLSELEKIKALAKQTGLSVGCQLNLRDSPTFRTVGRLIGAGEIGEIHTVNFFGQHPLMHGKRAGWYFEKGEHGGTINDIMIHALDAIPWLTGRQFKDVVAARAWNARLKEVPHFQDGAQVMLSLDNGGGVLGDASYLAPDDSGYGLPQYWRMTFHGDGGMIETHLTSDHVVLAKSKDQQAQKIALDEGRKTGYLDDFLAEISGNPNEEGVTSNAVFNASALGLEAQAIADKNFQG